MQRDLQPVSLDNNNNNNRNIAKETTFCVSAAGAIEKCVTTKHHCPNEDIAACL